MISDELPTKLVHAYTLDRFEVKSRTKKKIYQKGDKADFRYCSIRKTYECQTTFVEIPKSDFRKHFHEIKVVSLIDTKTGIKESWRRTTPNRYVKLENGKDTSNPIQTISSKVIGKNRRYINGVKADFLQELERQKV